MEPNAQNLTRDEYVQNITLFGYSDWEIGRRFDMASISEEPEHFIKRNDHRQ